MREIEFRGKATEKNTSFCNEWIEGNLIVENDKYYICLGINEHIKRDDYEVYMVQVIPETIGQYTGLKDINGKKIFGGDIVKDHYCIFEVVYDGNGFYIEVKIILKESGTDKGILYDLSDYKGLKVIGNIYDNPKLIKEGE